LLSLGALLQSDFGEILQGGRALTLSNAQHAKKPVLHIHNRKAGRDPLPRQVSAAERVHRIKRDPNAERSRSAASNESGVYRFALEMLRTHWQDREDRL
jgi:hypothetical protein